MSCSGRCNGQLVLLKSSHEQLRVLTMFCVAEDDPKEWPGPKAWPATLALISFFAVNVFGQVPIFSLQSMWTCIRKALAGKL